MNINLKKEQNKADLRSELASAKLTIKQLQVLIDRLVMNPDDPEIIKLKQKIVQYNISRTKPKNVNFPKGGK